MVKPKTYSVEQPPEKRPERIATSGGGYIELQATGGKDGKAFTGRVVRGTQETSEERLARIHAVRPQAVAPQEAKVKSRRQLKQELKQGKRDREV